MTMNKFFYILLTLVFFASCEEKKKVIEDIPTEIKKVEKTAFEMYEVSEMTALMERFYVNNQTIKKKILNGETDFGEFPEDYLTIHSAVLTDPTDRDDFFGEYSKKFLEAQSLVYSDDSNKKKNFNSMVNACIECHKVKCSGPIERIKKLYID